MGKMFLKHSKKAANRYFKAKRRRNMINADDKEVGVGNSVL
jgi:hypothetical protein